MSEIEFRLINKLSVSKSVDQGINTIIYNFINNACTYYLNRIFKFAPHSGIDTRNSITKLKNPFRKTNMGRKAIFSICPSTCLTQLKMRIV